MNTTTAGAAVWTAAQKSQSDKHRYYWMCLSSSLEIAQKQVPRIIAFQADQQTAYEAARVWIIEWWTVRAFLKKLELLQKSDFDQILQDLKYFRDALAHSDERADRLMIIKGMKGKVSTKDHTTSLAGGSLSTTDGVAWTFPGNLVGLQFSTTGLHAIFGMVDNWIITNTYKGAVQLQLSQKLFDELDAIIVSDAKRY